MQQQLQGQVRLQGNRSGKAAGRGLVGIERAARSRTLPVQEVASIAYAERANARHDRTGSQRGI
jgi:hypothetical protein